MFRIYIFYVHADWLIDWNLFPFFFESKMKKKNIRFEETEEQKPDDAFREVITSCRSLSSYEPNSLKTALPQVKSSIAIKNFINYQLSIGNFCLKTKKKLLKNIQ